jgi:hypothetical protein
MAMENVDRGVVKFDLKDGIGASAVCLGLLEELHVTTLGVAGVGDRSVPGSETFGKNLEVVAVQMHGMGGEREGIVHDESDGAVVGKSIDVPGKCK